MLGDINPQSVRIAQQAVVYPGRNHVNALTIKRYDGRSFKPVDLTDITRVVLAFPKASPAIVFDSAVDSVFTWATNVLTVDLSDYAMPASIQPSYLIVFDAEHPQGQVLVDNLDATLDFEFRLVPVTGTTPPPTAEFITDAPQDGETYGRKDGVWVTLEALVSGVASVNGKTGVVVLDAADVGAATAAQGALADSAVQPGGLAAVATSGAYADLSGTPTLGTAASADTGDFDTAGAAAGAVSAHVAASDPHTQYTTQTGNDARYERGLTAGTNITIDRTDPDAPVINASGGGAGEANTASNLGSGVGLFAQKAGVDLEFKGLVAGTNITLTPSSTGVTIDAAGGGSGAVDSVNGKTGVVVLTTTDIAEGTNLYYTDARAEAAAPVQTVDGQTGAVDLTGSYAPLSHVGGGGTAHANAVASGAAGFMTGADKAKLDGMEAGAQANVATDIAQSTRTSTTVLVTSSTGTDATLTAASTSEAGVMSAADKTKLDGVAADANNYTHPNHSGDVTSTGDGAQTITNDAVTNAKLANMDTATIKGRTTAGTGDPEDLTAAQARTLLNVADGATANSSDASLRDRATHTGTQAASTISDFNSSSRAQTEAMLVAGTNVTLTLGSSGATRTLTIDASGSGGASLPVVQALSSTRSLVLADVNTFNVNSTSSDYTVTIDDQATVTWTDDAEIHFLRAGTGDIVIEAETGVLLNGVDGGSVTMTVQNGVATIKRIAEDEWWVGGLLDSIDADRFCTAWVNFNGTGTVAIRDSYNVSSITDNGTGDYTINFATALSNANYSVCASAQRAATNNLFLANVKLGTTPTTTAFNIITVNGNATAEDSPIVSVLVFGGNP